MISVCDAVSQFNDGAKGRYHLFKQLEVGVGENSRKALLKQQNNRLRTAAVKVTAKYKKRGQMLRSLRKKKANKSDKTYVPGNFQIKLPLILILQMNQ